MAGANEVQAALTEALAGDDATSQVADTSSSPEVTDALAEALKGTTGEENDGTSDDETEESTEDSGKGQKTVPYDRLSKVVKQKNEITERFKTLEDQFKTATARENELRGRVGELEQDSQILGAIKDLAQDDKYRDHVVAIDKALQGIEDEVESAEEKGDDKAVSKAEKAFDKKAAELDTLIKDHRAENLWTEAQGLAKDMLAALPDDYTDEDRKLIGKIWTPHVDWDGIESTGRDAIPNALNQTFADAIKEYGTPRGALVAKTTKEIESRIPEAKQASSETTVKDLLAKDWAATNEDGKAEISDDEFNKGMAALMRATNQDR